MVVRWHGPFFNVKEAVPNEMMRVFIFKVINVPNSSLIKNQTSKLCRIRLCKPRKSSTNDLVNVRLKGTFTDKLVTVTPYLLEHVLIAGLRV